MLIIQVLIYVFDVESRELEKDLHYYQSCLEAILQVLAYIQFHISIAQFRTVLTQKSSAWFTRWTLCKRTRGR